MSLPGSLAVILVLSACGSATTGLPDEALQLSPLDQAGLYGAVARQLGESADGADSNSRLRGVNRFYVLDRPTLDLGSIDQSSRRDRFEQMVLDAIRNGIGGAVVFVDDPTDALVPGDYQVPLTTTPGQTGPNSEAIQGLVAPPGWVLIMFGVPYPVWGGGFTGGDWPSDAEFSVDLNVMLYQSPSEASTMSPGIEKRDGEWRIAGFRTMGTTTTGG